jgi:ATP synthase protein I
MSDSNEDPDESRNLEELSERLREARGKDNAPQGGGPTRGSGSASGLGIAMRMSTEFVAAVVIGGGIGWVLDNWLGTSPIFLLIFFFLGTAAGFLNVIRSAREMDAERKDGSESD